MPQWLKDFSNENINGIIVGIIVGLVVAGILYSIPKTFKWLGKVLSRCKEKPSTRLKKVKKWFDNRRTIGKLRRLEIREIPKDFLRGKSPEKNPELKEIYRMIGDKTLKLPPQNEVEKLFEKHPELKDVKFDIELLKSKAIKMPKPPDFRK